MKKYFLPILMIVVILFYMTISIGEMLKGRRWVKFHDQETGEVVIKVRWDWVDEVQRAVEIDCEEDFYDCGLEYRSDIHYFKVYIALENMFEGVQWQAKDVEDDIVEMFETVLPEGVKSVKAREIYR